MPDEDKAENVEKKEEPAAAAPAVIADVAESAAPAAASSVPLAEVLTHLKSHEIEPVLKSQVLCILKIIKSTSESVASPIESTSSLIVLTVT